MKVLLIGLVGFVPMVVGALSLPDAQDELASELAFCAGYYSMGAVLSENSGHKEEAENLRPTIERALYMSAKLSSPKKAQARLELAMQSQMKTFKEEGFARLMLQYAETCKAALERPDERLQYWVSRK